MADDKSDRVLDSPLGSAGDHAGVERLFELSPDRDGRRSAAADKSATQGDRSPSTLSVIKESSKVVAPQASPPAVVGVSLLSPTGRQALEPLCSLGLTWSALDEEEFTRFKAWQALMQQQLSQNSSSVSSFPPAMCAALSLMAQAHTIDTTVSHQVEPVTSRWACGAQ